MGRNAMPTTKEQTVFNRRAIIAGTLMSGLAAAGLGIAVLPAFGQTPSADQIVRRVADQAKTTTSVRATIAVSSSDSRLGGPIVAEVWSEKPGKARAEVRQSPLSELNGALAVADGQTASLYLRSKNQVIVGSRAELEAIAPKEQLPAQALDLNAAVDELFKRAEVRLLGSETVDGIRTYKLEATPKPGTTERRGSATVWIDQSRSIPVKAVFTTNEGTLTITAKNIDLNPKLDAALWRFTPPAGAEVLRAADLRPQPLTLDQARALASPKVLIPETLPGGASLVKIERVGQSVVQTYAAGNREFVIWSGPADAAPRLTGRDVERVTVRGVSGALREADGMIALTWSEHSFAYAISGRLSRDDALRLAAALRP
ncbi:MAG: outer membrane lipoprotein-sorting protein [Chloroflexota bacterium]|nr:outer membrane lipoprotein-sorting protein [Dehalococcoidia bacterium]MDW8252989.1 outer membrane lipoprotein-sorting protein [Chloroflexota bacterium]